MLYSFYLLLTLVLKLFVMNSIHLQPIYSFLPLTSLVSLVGCHTHIFLESGTQTHSLWFFNTHREDFSDFEIFSKHLYIYHKKVKELISWQSTRYVLSFAREIYLFFFFAAHGIHKYTVRGATRRPRRSRRASFTSQTVLESRSRDERLDERYSIVRSSGKNRCHHERWIRKWSGLFEKLEISRGWCGNG